MSQEIHIAILSLHPSGSSVAAGIKKWLRHISVVKVFYSGYTFSLSEPDFQVQ